MANLVFNSYDTVDDIYMMFLKIYTEDLVKTTRGW
jgi:hypothetical protein